MHYIPWLKSSYSGNTGNCVEVAFAGHVVAVRDSKDPAGPQLVFAPHQWRAFALKVKAAQRSTLNS
jgi:hypothetical protein